MSTGPTSWCLNHFICFNKKNKGQQNRSCLSYWIL
uniref:Uncharacterized protein n=1 Tax=Arundo donax TaxID=35708 RepID=A0A0A9AZG3_ARUDO